MRMLPHGFGVRIAPVVALVVILCFGAVGPTRADEKHISGGKALAVGGSSFALFWAGHEIKRSNGGRYILMAGPLPGEMSVQRFLGGEYYDGKNNWFDAGAGSVATPVLSGVALMALNLSYPREDKGKDVAQDLFLYSSGLAAVKGLTDMAKGLVGRPRPYVRLADDFESSRLEGDRVYKNSSFFSSHASNAFFSMTYLNKRARSIMRREMSAAGYRNWRWAPPTALYGWAAYIAWTRIQAYRHYISDVTVGALAGYLVAELFFSFNDKLDRPSETDGPEPSPVFLKVSFSF